MLWQQMTCYFYFCPVWNCFLFQGDIPHLPLDTSVSLKNDSELLPLHPRTKKKVRDKHNVRHILKWKRIRHTVHPLCPAMCSHHWFSNNIDVITEIIEVSTVHRALMLISQSAQTFSEYGNYMFTARLCSSNFMSQKHHIWIALK